jgi:hypothetical protein
MGAMRAQDIKELDGHSAEFRRMYFHRNLLRTQMELSGAIRVLLGNEHFKKLLERQTDKVKAQFAIGASAFEKAHSTLKAVRNDIAGHVLESAVQAALEKIDSEVPDAFGFLDVGPKGNLTHYKFVGELTAEILLKDVSAEERRQLASSKFALLIDLLPTFNLIEHCLLMYVRDRKLLDLRE